MVITADGDGDYGVNATVSLVKNDKVSEIFRTKKQHMGKIWRYVTLILGMKPQQHEYKVMGLAPYAKDEYSLKAYRDIFEDILCVKNCKVVHNKRPKNLFNHIYGDSNELNMDDEITNGSMLLNKGEINNKMLQSFIDKRN